MRRFETNVMLISSRIIIYNNYYCLIWWGRNILNMCPTSLLEDNYRLMLGPGVVRSHLADRSKVLTLARSLNYGLGGNISPDLSDYLDWEVLRWCLYVKVMPVFLTVFCNPLLYDLTAADRQYQPCLQIYPSNLSFLVGWKLNWILLQ